MLCRRARGVRSLVERSESLPDAPTSATTYRLRTRMFTIGQDYWIEDLDRRRTFAIGRAAARSPGTLVMRDSRGAERLSLPRPSETGRDVLTIDGPCGRAAQVVRSMTAPLREQFAVDLAVGGRWSVSGSIVDHEYEIEGPGGRIATVSKRWFHSHDSFGVAIAPGEDDPLVLGVAIAVDELVHG
jgi:uncharacterized protein YxjI